MFSSLFDKIIYYKRKIFPKTLLGRALFIVFLMLSLLEIFSFYVFYRPYNAEILKLKTGFIAHSIGYVVEEIEQDPNHKEDIFRDAQDKFKINFLYNENASFSEKEYKNEQNLSPIKKRIQDIFSMYLSHPFVLYDNPDLQLFLLHIKVKSFSQKRQDVDAEKTLSKNVMQEQKKETSKEKIKERSLTAENAAGKNNSVEDLRNGILQQKGQKACVLVVNIPYSVVFPEDRYATIIFWVIALTSSFFIVAAIFINNQIKPFRRIIRILDRFSKGHDITNQLKFLGGSTVEMRQASEAVKRMIFRIQRQMRQRTDMLSVVSHDLRTPITRMKLELELFDPQKGTKSIEALQSDLLEMEKMIDGYLTFARGEGHEKSSFVHVHDVINDVIFSWRDHINITFSKESDEIGLHLKVEAFKRCLNNILSNASRYASVVSITLSKKSKKIFIVVEDNGPGIDKKYLENDTIFRPFYRLEHHNNSKGSGLGFAIIKDIMRSHGGDVSLSRSEKMGGLKVTLFFNI